MAALNPEAPEFVSANSLPSLYNSLPVLPYSPQFLPCSTYFYPSVQYSYFSASPVIEIPPSLYIYYSNNYFYMDLPWQMNPQQPTEIRALPCITMGEQAEVEKKVMSEKIKPRVAAKGDRNPCLKRGGRMEGFQAHDSEGKQIWRSKSVSGENQSVLKLEPKVKAKPRPKPRLAEVEPVEPEGTKTTVMIRNIPNKFTLEMLLNELDDHCMKENQMVELENPGEIKEDILAAFDFVYLPMDFGSGCNKGYAFVNLTDPRSAWKLHLSLHNRKWDVLGSKKICEISCARIQGKEALIKHFQNSMFACESDEYLPVHFTPPRDGSGGPVQRCTVGKRIDPGFGKHTSCTTAMLSLI